MMNLNLFSGHEFLKEGASAIARVSPEKADAILSALYNYDFHWSMSLDFNQSSELRELHKQQARHYAEEILSIQHED